MDSDTLKALRESIAKWEGIVSGVHQDNAAEDCPLCKKFGTFSEKGLVGGCGGCIIKKHTGANYCEETPYIKFLHKFSVFAQRIVKNKAQRQAAIEELDFLKSFLP